tara:strand:+ start:68 stop:502 length:435 start_codon:yes stop_codon:yes gene_type:complete
MVLYLKYNAVLYRQTHLGKSTTVSQLPNLSWFSPVYNYGQSYGPVITSYLPNKSLKLLNLGKMSVRLNIIKKYPDLKKLLDPDEQYSGGKSNKKLHVKLRKYFQKKYAGTIIVDKLILEKDKYMLEGPSEVVLWGKLSNIIKRI